MSYLANRRGTYGSTAGSTINQKAALASAYQELGKELSSGKLKAVGNYTLQRPIGEGTYGKVRLGLHRLTNTRVAIKQVPKAHSASLTREIHHHRRLHHPNVMKLYEVIATEQYIWMVSELCAGGELYDYLVEREYLPEAEGRRIFGQLCLAVAYIHGKGIVHRDLKLENVLLDERCNVKLGDFGFTREFEGKKLMDTFCGTTGYAAPEMLAGKRYTGEEVDVWSLGIILYALLCGALPFDDDDDSLMKEKIMKGEFELPEVLSSEAKDLITSILQQDPLKRPTIQSILAHAWFTKTMVSTPMTTVEETEPPIDYFQTRPASGGTTNGPNAAADDDSGPSDTPGGAAGLDLPAKDSPNQSAAESQALGVVGPDGGSSPPASPGTAELGGLGHQSSVSGAFESSFYSARSDSESSDRRSSTTDITDPTTADSNPRSDSQDDLPTPPVTHVEADPSDAAAAGGRAKLPRNESQATIKRVGSNGSDASHGTSLWPAAKLATSSLPTHHELPNSSASSSVEDPPVMLRSVSLVKRGSQSSSRGHHRTPSRTKRRSVSSGGLSDHHPPHVGSRPIDYVAQLTQSQTAIFSTALEQNLLHQLSSLGFDVGQLVHSICTDACDASGAMWWMLVRKAQDKEATLGLAPALSTPSTPPLSDPTVEPSSIPPPLPQKDPSRRSQDRSRFGTMTGSRSADSAVFEQQGASGRLYTVISQEEMRAGARAGPSFDGQARGSPRTPSASISASPSLNAVPTDRNVAVVEYDATGSSTLPPATPSKTSTSIPTRPRHRHTPTTPSSLGSMRNTSPNGTGSPGTPKAKRHPQADRARSNSLSMKQFASTVLGTRERSPQVEQQVCVAGENLPFERAKSPSIFGKRTTSAGGIRESPSIAGKLATGSSPKKMSLDAAALDKGSRKSTSKRSVDMDLVPMKVKGIDKGEAGSASPGRHSGPEEAKATPSASVDSFSTTSLTPQNSEKGAKQRSGSSFMATVRTWLGANEKPSGRKQQQKNGGSKKAGKAGSSSLGYDGPASASQLAGRQTGVRKRGGAYPAGTIHRRPSKLSQAGSLSRRSSTGSSKPLNPDYISPPHPQYGRPSTLRRLSAGSITPTGTLYGDYMQEHGPIHGRTPSRSSRPSSGHSQHLPMGLQGRKGSASSASSAYRMQAGSSYSSGSGRRQAHRLSHDGGTVVRRHRAYGSSTGSPSRQNSKRNSRPGSLHSRSTSPARTPNEGGTIEAMNDIDDFGRAVASGTRTPRRSLEAGSRRGSLLRNETPSGRHSPASSGTGTRAAAHQHQHSVFVAHKSRTPYKPPSANASLHGGGGSFPRGPHHQHHPHPHRAASSTLTGPKSLPGLPPAAGTGTWRHSWGRPPPSWAGPVDPPPPEPRSNGLAAEHGDPRPKLRDVFSNREGDEDWTDEDDEPAYSGGLGQLDSLSGGGAGGVGGGGGSSSSGIGGGWGDYASLNGRSDPVRVSPYTTRAFREYGSLHGGVVEGRPPLSMASRHAGGSGGSGGNVLGYGRYAGVRGLFQPPSLGSEFAPKTLSTVLDNDGDSVRKSLDTVGSGESPKGPEGIEGGVAAVSSPLLSPAPSLSASVGMTSSGAGTGGGGVGVGPGPSAAASAAAAAGAGAGAGAGSSGTGSTRIRAGSAAASSSAFKGTHIIEEEEEDE